MIRSLRRTLILAASLAGGIACAPAAGPSVQSGTLAMSADGKQLFVADADNDKLVVVDPAGRTVTRTIGVGKAPTRVVVGKDGRVFVSNSQDRSVSVVDVNTGVEKKRIAVGAEPTGMALSADGQTLLVANTTNATVSVVDLGSLSVKETIQTDADPSGVAFLPDGRAYVTHLRSGQVSVLDKVNHTVINKFGLKVPLPTAIASTTQREPGQPTTPVIDPAGRVFIPHSQVDVSPIATVPSGEVPNAGGGSAYAGGGDGFTIKPPVVAPAIATIDLATGNILAGSEDTFGRSPTAGTAIVPPTLLAVQNTPLAGPSAAVVDPSGRFLYITHMNSNNVAIVGLTPTPTTDSKGEFVEPVTRGFNNIAQIVDVGAGPNGIVIPPSGDRAYVYNSFDHTISVIQADGATLKQKDFFKVGSTSLTPEQDLGRRLFFDASDSRMTNTSAGGIACASCHPGGREDGRTWQFTEGPRNTPTLAGRHLRNTAPYHWDGALNTMHDFNFVITQRMGGVGDGSTDQRNDKVSPLSDADFNAMLAFLDGQYQPDNPLRDQMDVSAVQRGHELFNGKANCGGCHTESSDFTDNGFHNVGSVGSNELFPSERKDMVNTPTLHNLFATAPYLHDGSKPTLRARIDDDKDGTHGTTSGLTEAEKEDLVAYLNTL